MNTHAGVDARKADPSVQDPRKYPYMMSETGGIVVRTFGTGLCGFRTSFRRLGDFCADFRDIIGEKIPNFLAPVARYRRAAGLYKRRFARWGHPGRDLGPTLRNEPLRQPALQIPTSFVRTPYILTVTRAVLCGHLGHDFDDFGPILCGFRPSFGRQIVTFCADRPTTYSRTFGGPQATRALPAQGMSRPI